MIDLERIAAINAENKSLLEDMAAKGAPISRPSAADVIDELLAEVDKLQSDVLALAAKPTTDFPLTEVGSAQIRPDGRLGCVDCGELYGGPRFPDLVIPDAVFAQIAPVPPDGGILCPNCINARLEAAGLFGVPGAFMSGAMSGCMGDVSAETLGFIQKQVRQLKSERDALRSLVKRIRTAIRVEESHDNIHPDVAERILHQHTEGGER